MKKGKKDVTFNNKSTDKKTEILKNKRNEDYQNDVIMNELNNNRGIHTFNNQSK